MAEPNSGTEQRGPRSGAAYEIRVKGQLDGRRWSLWFDGMSVRLEPNGETVLAGQISDQAALHGLLAKVRDLGLPLLEVRCVKTVDGDSD